MSLPTTGEPLKLADGSLVYPDGRIVEPNSDPTVNMVEVPTNSEAQALVINARRKLSDLPDVPKTMNAVGVVLAYTLFGLDDTEIALASGLSEAQIGRMKMLDAYSTMHRSVVQSVMDAEAGELRNLFTQHARTATQHLVHVMTNGKNEGNRLAAARDVLDRAGLRPADVVQHNVTVNGGLRIEYVRKEADPPTIDVEMPI